MQISIDPTLVERLEAIKFAYESGAIASVPYIEPKYDGDFSHFTQIVEIKKQEDSGGATGSSSGGGGSARGLRQNTKRMPTRR